MKLRNPFVPIGVFDPFVPFIPACGRIPFAPFETGGMNLALFEAELFGSGSNCPGVPDSNGFSCA